VPTSFLMGLGQISLNNSCRVRVTTFLSWSGMRTSLPSVEDWPSTRSGFAQEVRLNIWKSTDQLSYLVTIVEKLSPGDLLETAPGRVIESPFRISENALLRSVDLLLSLAGLACPPQRQCQEQAIPRALC
jgi:hypothetical protein